MIKTVAVQEPVAALVDERYESVEIKWNNKVDKLFQIHSSGFALCWANQNAEQVGVFVHCKDYMQDALLGHISKTKLMIHGYTYDPASDLPLDTEAVHLLIRDTKNKDFQKSIPRIEDFIHQIEDHLGFDRSVFRFCSNSPSDQPTYLIEGDKRWIIASPMLSLYCLLIRLGGSHVENETFQETMEAISKDRPIAMSCDRSYLKTSKNAIDLILEVKNPYELFGDDINKNYSKVQGIHSAGIVAYAFYGKQKANVKAYEKKNGKTGHMQFRPYCDHWFIPDAPPDYVPMTY